MDETNQEEVIRFLRSAEWKGDAASAEVVETHGAYVFLSGEEALKIKRAAMYDYMDFSRLTQREAMLRRELELNLPTAPQIYRDVVAVTREPGRGLALGGTGEAVEWVLRMWRFPADAELEAIAERGAFSDELSDELGRSLAAYHRSSERRAADGAELMHAILEELDTAFVNMHEELPRSRTEKFRDLAAAELRSIAALLVARGRAGHVRRGHGDLHLRNLVLIEGKPVPFDALEFDETLGTCDVLYDLAFLIMDLCHRNLPRAANITLNSYLLAVEEEEDTGTRAFPLFLAVRAAIRAMVDIQIDRARGTRGQRNANARLYLEEALAFLAPREPRLLAVGGFSGTGKTTLARCLAPEIDAAPGAVHLRSDLERKSLEGVDATVRLPAEAYNEKASRRVYKRLLERAERLLDAGRSVLVDAAFLSEEDRCAFDLLAKRLQVPFAGIWLEAEPDVLIDRVAVREGDASDADPGIVSRQLQRGAGRVGWLRIDTGNGIRQTEVAARRALARSRFF